MQTESQRQYYLRNKEKIIARIRHWQQQHPNQVKSHFKKRIRPSSRQYATFSFYRDFFKPFRSLPTADIEDLIHQFQSVSLPHNQFIILSLMLRGDYTQAELSKSLKFSQPYVSRLINKQLMKQLAPIICNYKTDNQQLLDLILLINLKWISTKVKEI